MFQFMQISVLFPKQCTTKNHAIVAWLKKVIYKEDKQACKPGSVLNGHLSKHSVTA